MPQTGFQMTNLLASEIDALDRLAAERGYDRFHLYGYSIGGSIALAYVAAYPDKVVSLAVDMPRLTSATLIANSSPRRV